MTQVMKPQTTTLYDRDLALWIEGTIEQLKARNFESLDIDNLIAVAIHGSLVKLLTIYLTRTFGSNKNRMVTR